MSKPDLQIGTLLVKEGWVILHKGGGFQVRYYPESMTLKEGHTYIINVTDKSIVSEVRAVNYFRQEVERIKSHIEESNSTRGQKDFLKDMLDIHVATWADVFSGIPEVQATKLNIDPVLEVQLRDDLIRGLSCEY